MQAKVNSITSRDEQPNRYWVICSVCRGQNYAENMVYQRGRGYVCEFCLLDENEPIPFVAVERGVNDDPI